MTQDSPSASRAPLSVSVGVCAYNEQHRIGPALDSLLTQAIPEGFVVSEILVVASGCTDATERVVEGRARADSRITLVRQPVRLGKASAINAYLSRARGEILVFLNGDALLAPGSLSRLLEPFSRDPDLQIACGLPIPESDGPRLVQLFVQAQWGLHNRALETLGRLGMPNHCCDEFLAMRRGFVPAIPPDLINDGAFLAVLAERQGHPVLILPDAPVYIEVPHSLRGALMQRRRIVRGHHQIHEMLDRPTNTLESLFFRHPDVVLGTVREEFLRRPVSLLRFLLLLVPIEALANALATWDRIRAVEYQPAWVMIE